MSGRKGSRNSFKTGKSSKTHSPAKSIHEPYQEVPPELVPEFVKNSFIKTIKEEPCNLNSEVCQFCSMNLKAMDRKIDRLLLETFLSKNHKLEGTIKNKEIKSLHIIEVEANKFYLISYSESEHQLIPKMEILPDKFQKIVSFMERYKWQV